MNKIMWPGSVMRMPMGPVDKNVPPKVLFLPIAIGLRPGLWRRLKN